MKFTGAQIIWECILREGVKTVFGYPGGANLPLYDALLDFPYIMCWSGMSKELHTPQMVMRAPGEGWGWRSPPPALERPTW